ncbi:hypothetical protein EKO04_009779 [Ascochyta lentis]|uniref:Uncharacterized protein n=1 Tax=Ascochyta lentis TaxID=205686 RepID=A0A8H7MGL7_9PLEO|nr:hypothetical protein EKO04_009779 [Ascochyta lentis]
MTIFTPDSNKTRVCHYNGLQYVLCEKCQRQANEHDYSPASAYGDQDTPTELLTPVEPGVTFLNDGPARPKYIYYAKATEVALRADFYDAENDVYIVHPAITGVLEIPLYLSEEEESDEELDETCDEIPPELIVFIQHPATVLKQQQAEFGNASDGILSARPLLLRRSLKRTVIISPLICSKDWPNGDVDSPRAWASEVNEALQGIDGNCD